MSMFVLDSGFFIQAHRNNYPLDVVPGFWNKVKQLASEEKIISIDKVKKEIYRNEDALKEWCVDSLPSDFFKDSAAVITAYQQVAIWANSRGGHYMQNALAKFLHADEADAFVIAYAFSDIPNRIIVTQEKSEPARKNEVKIPDVCMALGISYCNTIEMFRQLGITF